jgi:ketosteroid isomerase-like protein
MKTILSILALLPVLFVIAAGQNPKPNSDGKVEQELRSLVRAWDDAYVKGDTATLDRLLASEFAFVGGPKKSEYLSSFKSRSFMVESAVSTDIQVQVYGDTAVLTGLDTITGKNKDQTVVSKWLYMDVWIKRGGRWQCVKTYSMPVQNREP